ncbi:MAG TPA: translocation/assembly module TamB domain-containing protein, partial [Anaeromyxobacteraceae bacterium]|nr:translocation/assembly module TamB domain-containing protein [Anaeromyxobacteraceae bacterium]
LDRLALAATVEAPGERARLRADLAREGSTLATVEASFPLRAAELIADPAACLRALAAAPVEATIDVPGADLASLAGAAGPEAPFSGTLQGKASVSGTLAAPVAEARLSGAALAIAGHRLGDLAVEARYRDRRAEGEVRLQAAAGGSLAAEASLGVDLAPGAADRTPGEAPARLRLRSEDLDLGFLAAVAPNRIRSASGRIAVDLAAEGPLRSLRPRGTVRLEGGRVATVDHGEWTGGALDLLATEEAVLLRRLEVRRGSGRLEATGSVRGLAGGAPARLEGRLAASSLTLVRGAQEVATLDGAATVRGDLAEGRLEATVEIGRTAVRLPKQLPRELQTLDRRRDIVVGRARIPRPAPSAGRPAPAGPPPVAARVRLVASDRIEVRSQSPRASVDLVADVTLTVAGGQVLAEGSVDVARGEVEPISGRNFTLERGKVRFTGGPPRAGTLEVRATYRNPAATVTVTITGPLSGPPARYEIDFSSDPHMDEGAIAMLIATGQADFRPGTGAVGTLEPEEAGRAALGAVVTRVFTGLVAEKLPLDSVLDASTLRAGTYIGDRVYVTYVRRFDAKTEKGEATDEVQLQYRVSRDWKLEAAAGSARNFGASLIWTRDY